MVIEVPGDERDVEIAGFANRLAVVEALEHREQARVALDLAGKRVQVAGAGVRRQPRPRGRGGVGGGHGGVDVRFAALRDARQDPLRGGVDRLEVLACGGGDPATVDKVAEPAVVMLLDPLERRRVALRRRPILHRLEQLGDGGHLDHRLTVRGGVAPRDKVFELALDIGQQGAGP